MFNTSIYLDVFHHNLLYYRFPCCISLSHDALNIFSKLGNCSRSTYRLYFYFILIFFWRMNIFFQPPSAKYWPVTSSKINCNETFHFIQKPERLFDPICELFINFSNFCGFFNTVACFSLAISHAFGRSSWKIKHVCKPYK